MPPELSGCERLRRSRSPGRASALAERLTDEVLQRYRQMNERGCNYVMGRVAVGRINLNAQSEAEEACERAIELQRTLIQARPNALHVKNRLAIMLIDRGAIAVFALSLAQNPQSACASFRGDRGPATAEPRRR